MMAMRMEQRTLASESEAQLRRRARVISYRLMRGELVKIAASDPVLAYVPAGIRVAPGAAGGGLLL